MNEALNKVWVLGGAFYLSLFVLVLGYWVGNKRVKNYLNKGVVICAAVLAIYFSFGEETKLNWTPGLFFRPVVFKEDEMTARQFLFSTHLQEILPTDSTGCVSQLTDLPAYYLRNQLYPRRFVLTTVLSKNCDYIVSPFAPVKIAGFKLVDNYKGNYLYKLK